ncbi:hypothetical protein ACJX0J_011157, partial [Zea mays]
IEKRLDKLNNSKTKDTQVKVKNLILLNLISILVSKRWLKQHQTCSLASFFLTIVSIVIFEEVFVIIITACDSTSYMMLDCTNEIPNVNFVHAPTDYNEIRFVCIISAAMMVYLSILLRQDQYSQVFCMSLSNPYLSFGLCMNILLYIMLKNI